jgi:hypothetical protein
MNLFNWSSSACTLVLKLPCSHTRLLHHALCVHTTNRTQFDCRKDCLCPARIAPSWPSHRPSRARVLVCHDASHHRSSDACARACACGSVGVQMLLHRCIPLSNKWKARCDRSTHNHFFFILPLHVAETLINGLKRLEYRGYDSAGEQTPLACIATTTLRRPTHAPPGQSFCGRAFQPRLLFLTTSAASQPASSTRDPHFFCALRWVRITQVFALLNYNVHSGSRTRTHSLTRLIACSLADARTCSLATHDPHQRRPGL